MEELIKEDWNYILYKIDGQIVLSVLCGSSIEFFVNVPLNEIELQEYKTQGKSSIDKMASEIRFSPKNYWGRHIEIPE